MPTALEKKRGGVVGYRTIKLPGRKYAHVGITRKAGPKGGRTVMGKVKTKKCSGFYAHDKVPKGLRVVGGPNG